MEHLPQWHRAWQKALSRLPSVVIAYVRSFLPTCWPDWVTATPTWLTDAYPNPKLDATRLRVCGFLSDKLMCYGYESSASSCGSRDAKLVWGFCFRTARWFLHEFPKGGQGGALLHLLGENKRKMRFLWLNGRCWTVGLFFAKQENVLSSTPASGWRWVLTEQTVPELADLSTVRTISERQDTILMTTGAEICATSGNFPQRLASVLCEREVLGLSENGDLLCRAKDHSMSVIRFSGEEAALSLFLDEPVQCQTLVNRLGWLLHNPSAQAAWRIVDWHSKFRIEETAHARAVFTGESRRSRIARKRKWRGGVIEVQARHARPIQALEATTDPMSPPAMENLPPY